MGVFVINTRLNLVDIKGRIEFRGQERIELILNRLLLLIAEGISMAAPDFRAPPWLSNFPWLLLVVVRFWCMSINW